MNFDSIEGLSEKDVIELYEANILLAMDSYCKFDGFPPTWNDLVCGSRNRNPKYGEYAVVYCSSLAPGSDCSASFYFYSWYYSFNGRVVRM